MPYGLQPGARNNIGRSKTEGARLSELRFYPADEVEAALDYPALIAALRDAFAAGAAAPLRHVHGVYGAEDARLLLMPAWNEGRDIGVKLVTVFPHNAARGRPTVASLY